MGTPFACETFEFFRSLIYRHSGIHLTEKEAGILDARLRRRLKELRLASAEAYARLLTSPEGAGEFPALIDAVTTNYTFFFREPEHFQLFRAEALPRVLARKAQEGNRRLLLWSAGCSSGEEAYSLAISLAESLRPADGWAPRILATDINRAVLRSALHGVYPRPKLARLPQEYFYRYFVKDAETPTGSLRVCEEVRSMVAFRRQNILKEEPSFHGLFDFIFCRNVMIYFDRASQAALVRYFQTCLARGGYLFVSPREVLQEAPGELHEVSPFAYRRP